MYVYCTKSSRRIDCRAGNSIAVDESVVVDVDVAVVAIDDGVVLSITP